MTQKDSNATIQIFESKDSFGSLLGGKIVRLTPDECVYEYVAVPAHHNPNGILHGGALYSAMDSSQGAFVHFILEDTYKFAATGTATIRYLAPAVAGKIRIRTWLKGRERRKLFVCSTATHESGTELATLEEIWIAVAQAPNT